MSNSTPSHPPLEWRTNQTPVSVLFDDVYFSSEGGLEESRYVFLQGCDLPNRWSQRPNHRIGELGFGTGLNFLATWDLWNKTRSAGSSLDYYSCEKYPLSVESIKRALSPFAELNALAREFLNGYARIDLSSSSKAHVVAFPADQITLHLNIGEASHAIHRYSCIDTWFLDGFNPKKNPDMWTDEILTNLVKKSKFGSRLSTYTAKSDLRRRLSALNFKIQKSPGWGKKREMIFGIFSEQL